MKKISRRKFLKSAGVAALAVAAVGMMTGCQNSEDNVPGTNVPDVPTVTSKEITLYFFDNETSEPIVGANKTMKVLKDAKVVLSKDIAKELIPEDYHIMDKESWEIRDHGNGDLRAYVWVTRDIQTPATKEVEITCNVCNTANAGGAPTFTIKINVAKDATSYTLNDVKDQLTGYEILNLFEGSSLPLNVPLMLNKIL